MSDWDGDAYQRRFDELAASGMDVHGEATFVLSYAPVRVLDAGCGSGRVAIELARHGVEVVGVDADASMLAAARRNGPTVEWHEHDLTTLDLGRTFDAVVLAGNVPLFTAAGTQQLLVGGCARHVSPNGVMIAGFQLGKGYALEEFDAHCTAAGLRLAERFSTWDRQMFTEHSDYAVSVHRIASG